MVEASTLGCWFRYEANVMGMAAGPGPTRLARKAFVNQVNSAAWRLELDRKHAK